ncbi:sarcolemmal membrane-associated protein-like isoform X3 [Clytia hemisphaerica]|uniref:sarcolemmal membrane-associated protein-like isoform X3 n=1 Tax=Clytia hemisphaerica TaxID=252671 RepID=UPI0034D57D3A
MAALIAPRPNSHPFQERQLSLKEPIKIGRAVAKAKATQNNGIFDCRVLSRNHAMLWYENGKFFLQDTKSSNGTFVNGVRLSRGAEESEPCEIKSGDILQFGVEVVENTKNVTHGCIIGLATLFHEDGTEATGANEEPQSVLSLASGDKPIQPKELWQLSQFLQDALHREQMLENKLATLQRMISNSHAASDDTFQGFIQEDKVLSRLETLENQLELVSQELPEDEPQTQLMAYQDERLEYESAAKETLQKILQEKIEVLQKCSDLERLLSNTEDECTFLRNTWEKSKEELGTLMERHTQLMDELKQVKEDMTTAEQKHETTQQQTISEKKELKGQLEDAEKRGSSLAVEVESLQAECDFTKQQLQAMKERLETKQKEEEEDHATLEKDVKNKTALIRSLKEQIAEMQAKYEMEQLNKSTADDKNDDFNEHLEISCTQIKELDGVLQSVAVTLNTWSDGLMAGVETSTSFHYSEIQTTTNQNKEDCIVNQQKAIMACSEFLNNVKKHFEDVIARAPIERELSHNSTDESIKAQLTDAHNELDEVRSQIMILGDQLLEEQEINKRSKELAASLQRRYLQTHSEHQELIEKFNQVLAQLYEAQQHMNIEQLDKSMSYQSLESARRLADEMKQQASDYAKEAGHGRVTNNSLHEENETLQMKIARLENECKLLRQENQLLSKAQPSSRPSCSPSPQRHRFESNTSTHGDDENTTSTSNSITPEELQEQLKLAEESLEKLTTERTDTIERFTQRQQQLMNFITTILLFMMIFFVMILLGLIDVSPGALPLLDEHSWNEFLEHLF